jgi:hypothetical protein
VDLERGPLSLVIVAQELLSNSGSGLEIRKYCRKDPRDTLNP